MACVTKSYADVGSSDSGRDPWLPEMRTLTVPLGAAPRIGTAGAGWCGSILRSLDAGARVDRELS
jgi:hypothetical protein